LASFSLVCNYKEKTLASIIKDAKNLSKGQFSFKTLYKISGRATPEIWSNYNATCGLYNGITTCVPEDIFVNLTKNFLNSEKSQGL
jgi:hypothetical protein